MYCKKCGSKLQEGQKFCTKCGTPVEGGSAGNSNQSPEQHITSEQSKGTSGSGVMPPKKRNSRMIAGIIAAIVAAAAVVIVVVAVNRSNNSTEQIVETEQAKAVEDQDEGTDVNVEDEKTEKESEIEVEAGDEDALLDNLDLDLVITEGDFYDNLHDAVTQTPEGLIQISGTITNNNDVDCYLKLNYDIEELSYDNYGEEVGSPMNITSKEIQIAAHDTIPYYENITEISNDKGDTTYACTGFNVEGLGAYGALYEEDDNGNINCEVDIPLTVDHADITVTYEPEKWGYSFNTSDVAFKVINDTENYWEDVTVTYDIFVNGAYAQTNTSVAKYIKPGDTAEMSDTLLNNTDYIAYVFPGLYHDPEVVLYEDLDDFFQNVIQIKVQSITYNLDLDMM